MQAKLKSFKCVICRQEIENEYGNNPSPISEKRKCCNMCDNIVIAVRIKKLTGHVFSLREVTNMPKTQEELNRFNQ